MRGWALNRINTVFPNILPAILAKLTTLPRDFLINGRNVLVTSIIPHKLTSAVRFIWSSGIHSTGPTVPTPALFTSPHRPEIYRSKNISDNRILDGVQSFPFSFHLFRENEGDIYYSCSVTNAFCRVLIFFPLVRRLL